MSGLLSPSWLRVLINLSSCTSHLHYQPIIMILSSKVLPALLLSFATVVVASIQLDGYPNEQAEELNLASFGHRDLYECYSSCGAGLKKKEENWSYSGVCCGDARACCRISPGAIVGGIFAVIAIVVASCACCPCCPWYESLCCSSNRHATTASSASTKASSPQRSTQTVQASSASAPPAVVAEKVEAVALDDVNV